MTRVYYLDSFDFNTSRWVLVSSYPNKKEAMNAMKGASYNFKVLQIRRVETRVIGKVGIK